VKWATNTIDARSTAAADAIRRRNTTNATAAIGTARVQQSIHKLAAQLLDLYHMAKSVGDAYVPPRN